MSPQFFVLPIDLPEKFANIEHIDMAAKTKRIYNINTLPAQEDLSNFAIPYTPEKFTKEEISYLKPFFSNVDKPVFIAQHLPEEVIGALSSRYSRATQSLRRLFLKEYIGPIVKPEQQKNWTELSEKERKEAIRTRDLFLQVIERLNKGESIEAVVNIQRGRKFFDTWLAQYGDDSIAEMGGIHLCIEGISIVAIKEFEDKRIGISPLEKSTRYVQFWEKRPDGSYQYIIPGEIKGTEFEKEYKEVLDAIFETYIKISEPYLEYIKKKYPKGDDETDRSFENSRSAKRFDDIRDILPFGHQTNFAMYGNGRAFEDVVNRCLMHPLGEVRWWGQQVCNELEKVVPSFVRRPKTTRGAEVQIYRYNLKTLRDELAKQNLNTKIPSKRARWIKLISYTPDADIEVLASFLYASADRVSLSDIRKDVKRLGVRKRKEFLERIIFERYFGKEDAQRQEVRFRKVPRAFENAHFMFDIWGRGSGYKDLQRHRMQTQERQLFTAEWGYDLEKDVLSSPQRKEYETALLKAGKLYKKIARKSKYAAQYVLPYAFIQHWYMNMTAREIYWLVELRTGPQGNPHYREIAQQIAAEATKAIPSLFSGLMTDRNDYTLARRESEKKIDRKLKTLEKTG